MEKAYNTLGQRSWDAVEFDAEGAKDKAWLKQQRQFFICGGCEEAASFVTKGRGAAGAHFRANHDEEGCDFASKRRQSREAPEDVEDVPAQFNEGSANREIRYEKLRPLNQAGSTAAGGGKGAEAGQAGVAHVLPEIRPRAHHSTTGLRRQLALLRNDPNYPQPDVRLHVPELGAVIATDYFCRFEDATADHARPIPDDPSQRPPLKAYWGVISRPIKDGNWLWLNPGEPDQEIMAVRVNYSPFMAALGITDHLDLTNYHLIVEGRLKQGRFARHVTAQDLTKLALRSPRVAAAFPSP